LQSTRKRPGRQSNEIRNIGPPIRKAASWTFPARGDPASIAGDGTKNQTARPSGHAPRGRLRAGEKNRLLFLSALRSDSSGQIHRPAYFSEGVFFLGCLFTRMVHSERFSCRFQLLRVGGVKGSRPVRRTTFMRWFRSPGRALRLQFHQKRLRGRPQCEVACRAPGPA